MTPLSAVLAFFPAAAMAAATAAAIRLMLAPSLSAAAGLLFVPYGVPLLAFRLHGWLRPVREGLSYLDGAAYSPWWGGHQIQSVTDTYVFADGDTRVMKVRWSAVIRRVEGQWRFLSIHIGTDLFDNPVLHAATATGRKTATGAGAGGLGRRRIEVKLAHWPHRDPLRVAW